MGEPQLLVDLAHGLVVEVGHPGVDPQHGLGHAQLVLAGRRLVVGEGPRQGGLAHVARGQLDGGLAVAVLGPGQGGPEPLDVVPQGLGLVDQLLEHPLGQRQHRAGGRRSDGEPPGVLGLHQRPVTEVVAVGQHPEHGLAAVLAGAQLVGPAVGDEEHLVGGLARCHDDVAAGELALDEAVGQSAQELHVVEASQQRQLGQLLGDDPHLGPGGDEADPPVTHRVARPAVHPVGPPRHLHPGQEPQQPPRRDPLHLGDGLGRGRQVAGRGRPQALRLLTIDTDVGLHRLGHDLVLRGRARPKGTDVTEQLPSVRSGRSGGLMRAAEVPSPVGPPNGLPAAGRYRRRDSL